jgi:hypothetical protein
MPGHSIPKIPIYRFHIYHRHTVPTSGLTGPIIRIPLHLIYYSGPERRMGQYEILRILSEQIF